MKHVTSILTVILIALVGQSDGAIHLVPEEFETIQEAINASEVNDTVIVARGTYQGYLSIQQDIVLAGEFILSQERHMIKDTEIIGGIDFGGVTNETEVSGFHFTAGDRDAGGALLISYSNPIISYCMFTENTATRGGAVQCRDNNREVEQISYFDNCHFERNEGRWGGTFNIDDMNICIRNCTFDGNDGNWSGGIFGSGRNSVIEVVNSSFHRHSADHGNSAMIDDGVSSFINCVFSDELDECLKLGSRGTYLVERCTFTAINGDPINFSGHQGASGTVRDCYFHHNTNASLNADIIENCDISYNTNRSPFIRGIPVIRNCSIYNNVGLNHNRSIISLGSSNVGSIIERCILFGNESPSGQIISAGEESTIAIEFCTFAENSCDQTILLEGNSDLEINNSIFTEIGRQNAILMENDEVTVSYSLFDQFRIGVLEGGDINIGEGVFDDDPQFVDEDNSEFYLIPDSRCIDAGDPESPLDPDNTRADLGAYYCSENVNLVVTPKIVSFIDIQPSESDSQMVIINNYGREVLHIDEYELVGDAGFSLSNHPEGFDIDLFESDTIWVVFTPDFRGEYRAELIIHSNDPEVPEYALTLQGNGRITRSNLKADLEVLQFEPVPVGDTDTVVVRLNPAPESVTVYDFWIQPEGIPIRITELEVPQKIYPDLGIRLEVLFSPQFAHEYRGTLTIEYGHDFDQLTIPIRANGVVSVAGQNEVPQQFGLSETFPNPFNSTTTISYSLPTPKNITLSIHNTRGQLVNVLVDRIMPAGAHNVVWEADDVSAGVYFVRMNEQMQKVVLVK